MSGTVLLAVVFSSGRACFEAKDLFREPKLCMLMAAAELGVRELDSLMAWEKKKMGAWRQERDTAIRTRTCACIRTA